MSARILVLAVFALVLFAGPVALAAAETPSPADFVGSWEGALAVEGIRLPLVFHLRQAAGGELEATIDSPAQGAFAIPVAAVEVNGATLRLDVDVLGAVYEGGLDEARQAIAGEWRQAGRILPLTVERR